MACSLYLPSAAREARRGHLDGQPVLHVALLPFRRGVFGRHLLVRGAAAHVRQGQGILARRGGGGMAHGGQEQAVGWVRGRGGGGGRCGCCSGSRGPPAQGMELQRPAGQRGHALRRRHDRGPRLLAVGWVGGVGDGEGTTGYKYCCDSHAWAAAVATSLSSSTLSNHGPSAHARTTTAQCPPRAAATHTHPPRPHTHTTTGRAPCQQPPATDSPFVYSSSSTPPPAHTTNPYATHTCTTPAADRTTRRK